MTTGGVSAPDPATPHRFPFDVVVAGTIAWATTVVPFGATPQGQPTAWAGAAIGLVALLAGAFMLARGAPKASWFPLLGLSTAAVFVWLLAVPPDLSPVRTAIGVAAWGVFAFVLASGQGELRRPDAAAFRSLREPRRVPPAARVCVAAGLTFVVLAQLIAGHSAPPERSLGLSLGATGAGLLTFHAFARVAAGQPHERSVLRSLGRVTVHLLLLGLLLALGVTSGAAR